MKMIRHENVVQLKEVLQTDRHIYVVLQLVTGGELFDKIVAAERFTESTARRFFQQLIMGVSYCHAQGVAHRDLKPENLLVDDKDNLKITDFGLSTLAAGKHGKKQLLQTCCGTPNYVAPEVLKETGYEGFKADIWSCGIILFVMLAGYLPFDADDVNILFKKIESGKFTYPPYFNKSVRDLLSKMLQVNPKKRITMDAVKNHKWFRVGFRDSHPENALPRVVLKPSEEEISHAVSEKNYKESEVNEDEKTLTPDSLQDAFAIANEFLMKNIHTMTSRLALQSQADNIRRNARFMAKGSQNLVIERIMDALKNVKATTKMKGKQEIKAFAYGDRSRTIITMTIVVSQTIEKNLSLVEVHRGRGSILEFHQFYRSLTAAIRDIMTTEPGNKV
eukprot:CAMPEP_0117455254 /NCGR_PEP_ID=MMETSP0759-20121206/11263_1 /TAXON_ID=63605 /ORGANISM="Percolomonas cosmopolitus, Strain WS" /LENGTH=390 /DNA_ID=CAMNT_0005248549 /DNA_START=343 /DNA_END=1515 /DNA_ORIENTATION=+